MAKKDQDTSTEPVEQATPDTAAVTEPTRFGGPAEGADAPRTAAPQYVEATAELFVGEARAHMPGDRVPVENVERNGWQDHVRPLPA